MKIYDLHPDVLTEIASFIPLFDENLNDVLNRFVTNIGIKIDVRVYICQRYFNNNLLILQGLLNSNLSVDIVDRYLKLWNECQPHQENKFISMINLFIKQSQHQVDGLQKAVFHFVSRDGRCCRDNIYCRLYDLIHQTVTHYQIPVLNLAEEKDGSLLRAIDNNSVFGLSKHDVLQLCMEKYDNGHTKVDFFVTRDTSRFRIVDVTFVNPVIGFLNQLNSIRQAWIDSARCNSVVSEIWGDQILHLCSIRYASARDMFISSDVMDAMVFGEAIWTLNPIVQIVYLKRIAMRNTDQETWKIVISDGSMFYTGLVPERLLHHVHNREIKQNAVIRILDFSTHQTRSGLYFFVLHQMQFLYHHMYSIGHPIDVLRDFGSLDMSTIQVNM